MEPFYQWAVFALPVVNLLASIDGNIYIIGLQIILIFESQENLGQEFKTIFLLNNVKISEILKFSKIFSKKKFHVDYDKHMDLLKVIEEKKRRKNVENKYQKK